MILFFPTSVGETKKRQSLITLDLYYGFTRIKLNVAHAMLRNVDLLKKLGQLHHANTITNAVFTVEDPYVVTGLSTFAVFLGFNLRQF